MTQRDALNILKSGKNVFITGPAGSGKTFVVNEYIRYLKEHDVPIGITASTGIAATHMGGVTIHSWTGIGIKDRLSLDEIEEIGQKGYVKNKLLEAKVLIIDEVSMLHHFRLDIVDSVLKHVRKSEEPFGGLQVVLCGDFFQLPPVSRMGEPEARFIYNSDSWKEAGFVVCYLHENFRQNNDPILAILNEIRSGKVSSKAREQLKSRHVKDASHVKGLGNFGDDEEANYSGLDEANYNQEENSYESVIDLTVREDFSGERGLSGKEKNETTPPGGEGVPNQTGIEPTRLYTHNLDVDSVNGRELNKVQANEIVYEMTSKGRRPLVETLKKTCLAPEILRLRKGARVMCVKNNFEKGYVNGTLGVVVSCAPDSDPVIRTAVSPDFPEGRLITIERANWQIADDGKLLAEISQYPLRLAWAITVHKSQGMSLDAIEVDLSKAFEPGMGYVALSRVRTLAGLSILGFSENALQVHREVLEHDKHFRELSDKAERILEYTDEKDITQKQNEFLAKVAPLHAIKKDKNGKKIKPPKLSTYDKTALLIKAEKTVREIAKERGLEEETVINQIESLLAGGKGVKETLNLSEVMYLKKEISPIHFKKLEKALEEVSAKQGNDRPPFLSPIKSKVGFNISWNEIKLARILLGYIRKI
ncbi:MAG: AAA family ATPase [Candidatus Paceibacterota bacterium]